MNLMLLAVAVTLITTIVIDAWLSSLAERRAKAFMNHIYAEDERVTLDDPYAELRVRAQSSANGQPRVAMIATGGAPNKFTSRQRTIPMALLLMEQGYTVRVYVPCWDCTETVSRSSTSSSVPVEVVEGSRFRFGSLDVVLFWRLLRKILRFEPDVLYCFKPIRYAGALAVVVRFLRRARLTAIPAPRPRVVVDSDDWEGAGGWAARRDGNVAMQRIRDWQERLTIANCDAVTTSTTYLRDRASRLRHSSESVYLVPNGIRRELWPLAPDAPVQAPVWLSERLAKLGRPHVLLLYTRFVEVQARDIIEVFATVLGAMPNTALLVVGSSRDPEARRQRLGLFSQAQLAGIDYDRILISGWVPFRDLVRTWSVADLAICPHMDSLIARSRFPMKVLELMAAGKAIVATSVGEIPQLIDNGESGILVPPGNMDEFSAHVIHLLQNPGLQRSLGEAARRRALSAFEWHVRIKQIESSLDISLQHKPRARDEDGVLETVRVATERGCQISSTR